MTRPVLVISDTHYHNFKQYAQINKAGINTRLGDIIRATIEAAKALRAAGGNEIVHCGDVFHVRGVLAPSVLNPVVEMYRGLVREGFRVTMISGNHDLETDIVAKVSSSVSALDSIDGLRVIHGPKALTFEDGRSWMFVPWIKDLNELRSKIRACRYDNLVIHAPLNGVISGIPEHGLNPNDFNGLGFKRVFCGHYHNHRKFTTTNGTEVYSVGALTHQNWGDVDSKAGYLLVTPGDVEHRATSAPQFRKVDFEDLDDRDDAYFADHYIKVVGGSFTDPSDIQAIKDRLLLRGAKAVVVEGLVRTPTATRGMTTYTTAPTVEIILGEYLDRTYPGEPKVKSLALDILNRVTDD